jgi:hypothetical protein
MKKLILLFSFVILSSCISILGQCNIKTKKDALTGLVTRSSGWEVVSKGLKLQIFQVIIKKDTTMSLQIIVTPTVMTCFGKDSRIEFKSGEDFITIPLSGENKCESFGGAMINFGFLRQKEDIIFLKQHIVEMARVYFTEGYSDYTIKKTDYFIRILNCF